MAPSLHLTPPPDPSAPDPTSPRAQPEGPLQLALRAAELLDARLCRLCLAAWRRHPWLAERALQASGAVLLQLAEAAAGGRQRPHRALGALLELEGALTLFGHRALCPRAEEEALRGVVIDLVELLG